MSEDQSPRLVDAFRNPIPDWAIWAHYEQVDVRRGPWDEERWIPGELKVPLVPEEPVKP